MSENNKGMLVLEDGSTFEGISMGASAEVVGEVVFNTAMTGYQEIITDPSYWGQIIAFTCPHIGNVGVNTQDMESDRPYARAIIARQICTVPSNWRARLSLPQYLQEQGVPALSGVDTRRLTLTIREQGTMRAALATDNPDRERLWEMARNAPHMSELKPIDEITIDAPRTWTEPVPAEWDPAPEFRRQPDENSPLVVVIDCGTKYNILRHLANLGARVHVVPAHSTAQQILALDPDGILVSNGPGDPRRAPQVIDTVRALVGQRPIFGICFGHQIIALACGGERYKMPFGHHGGNHPVQSRDENNVEITAQNHNYALAADSLADLPVKVTSINLYDDSVEGLRHNKLPVWSVQYHPEASPGPHDSLHLIREFVEAARAAHGRR